MQDDEKLEKEMEKYCECNYESIEEIYNQYLDIAQNIKLSAIWGKDQFSAMMMFAEQRHASLMERMELELEKNKLDPFASIKIATYIVGKNEDGAVALLYFKTPEKSIFAMKLLAADILENPDSFNESSVGQVGFEDDDEIEMN
jgi:hypothetical protein